jgi:hypothetical protein
MAMDSYFKLLRAEEEIVRLKVEIPRLATFMRDENTYLYPSLAHQIGIHRMESTRFIIHHTKVLNKIVALKGYSGGPLLGTRDIKVPVLVRPVSSPVITPVAAPVPLVSTSLPANINLAHGVEDLEDLEEEEAGDDEEREAMGAYYSVIQMSIDSTVT